MNMTVSTAFDFFAPALKMKNSRPEPRGRLPDSSSYLGASRSLRKAKTAPKGHLYGSDLLMKFGVNEVNRNFGPSSVTGKIAAVSGESCDKRHA